MIIIYNYFKIKNTAQKNLKCTLMSFTEKKKKVESNKTWKIFISGGPKATLSWGSQ